jgi:hypothetical protein
MEGYTNVTGNHEDFDDLDIEGRITLDEWNCEDETGMQVMHCSLYGVNQESIIIHYYEFVSKYVS